MDKVTMLRAMARTKQALDATVKEIPLARMDEPSAVGTWSVKDVIGHVATWDAEDVAIVKGLLAGGSLPRYSRDFNDRAAKRLRTTPLQELLDLYTRITERP